MLRIRLSRVGAKRQASYRIVVADKEAKRDGAVVERIGYYNPRTDPIEFRLDEARALHWLSVGAQPSDPVRRLLVKQGTLDRLARLRQGESPEALVAEFVGTPVKSEPRPAVAEVAALVAAVEATEAEVTATEAAETEAVVAEEAAAVIAAAEPAVAETEAATVEEEE